MLVVLIFVNERVYVSALERARWNSLLPLSFVFNTATTPSRTRQSIHG